MYRTLAPFSHGLMIVNDYTSLFYFETSISTKISVWLLKLLWIILDFSVLNL